MKLVENLVKKSFFPSQKNSFFIYQHSYLESAVSNLQSLFPNVGNIYFSVKANPNRKILRELGQMGVNFDVSSLQELEVVLSLDIPAHRITFSGPAKTNHVLSVIKGMDLKSIHLDSMEEYLFLKDSRARLSIRLPLEDEFSQKLGLPLDDLFTLLKSSTARFSGIHLYLGRERALNEIIQKNISFVKTIFHDYRSAFVNNPSLYWGGGFPAQSFLKKEMLPEIDHVELNLEAGRAICHEIGLFGAQVLSVKQRTPWNIIINGGLQYFASKFSSPQFGQSGLQVCFVSSENRLMDDAEKEIQADIFGSLGIWNDLLIQDIPVPSSLKRGDWILVSPAGAYGPSAGVSQFLGPDPVDEYYFKNETLIKTSPLVETSYLESGLNESRKVK